MSEKFAELNPKHIEFIQHQHIFFVGTAAAEGSVNVSPKGMDSLRVINNHRVIWLNLTGSGNETAAHILENERMTIMFCSFDKQPLILRLYGNAKMLLPSDENWNQLVAHFPEYTGARQIFDLTVNLVQTSCGYAVPFYTHEGERPTLSKWADGRGRDGIKQYWKAKNLVSLDGKSLGSAAAAVD